MATKPKIAQRCRRCGKPAEEGRRIRDGHCPSCREAVRRDPKIKAAIVTIDHRRKVRRAQAAGEAPPPAPAIAPARPPRGGDDQLVIAAITEGELSHLRHDLALARQTIAKQREVIAELRADRHRAVAAAGGLERIAGRLSELLGRKVR